MHWYSTNGEVPTNDKIEELTYLGLEAKALWNSRHIYKGL